MKFCRFDQNNKSEAHLGFAFFYALLLAFWLAEDFERMAWSLRLMLADLQNKVFKGCILIHPPAFDAFVQL